MNLSRNIIQGVAGGLIGCSVLGLVEAVYLLSSQGAPDLLSPFYAVVLYGTIGAGLGFGGGIALTILEKLGLFKQADEALAFQFGSIAGVSPLMLFILMYLGNKVVYAEQGVPLPGKLAVLGIVLFFIGFELTLGRGMVREPLAFILKGRGLIGTWGGLLGSTFLLSLVPMGENPRDTFASGKVVPAGMADKPNVLVISIDTLRADYLGAYGKEGNPTPVLDSIAADGIVFEKFFTNASWTRSSFASLWTSRIPSSHNTDKKASRMPDELDLLSEVLQGSGVTTGNLVNNINVTSTFNFDQGWDSFIYESPEYSFGATESVFSLTLYKVVHKLNEKLGRAKHVSSFYQPIERLTEDAKGFISANKGSRWLLGMHLMEPHDPYFEHPYLDGTGDAEFNGVGFARAEVESPDIDQAEYLKKVYLQEIIHMDLKLASFVDWLKAEGFYDDMMIVVLADHGEEFGEHGGFWHGTTLYAEQIHIPLIIKPAKNQVATDGSSLAGTRVSWQARIIDVSPTIAASLGVTPSEQWEGTDLLVDVREELEELAQKAAEKEETEANIAALKSRLEGEEVELSEDVELSEGVELSEEVSSRLLALNIETSEQATSLLAELEALAVEAEGLEEDCLAYRNQRERFLVAEQDFEGNVLSAAQKSGFKYIRANDGNPRGLPVAELFDMVADSGETTNLVGSDAQKCGLYVADLQSTLNEEMGAAIVEALSHATDGGEAEMSAAEKQRLCALGYLSGEDCE